MDCTFYPHLVDLIVQHAADAYSASPPPPPCPLGSPQPPSLLGFRGTCKRLRSRFDARIFHHIAIPGLGWTTPSFRMLPPLCRIHPFPHPPTGPEPHPCAAILPPLLAHTRVLDIHECINLESPPGKLDVIRSRQAVMNLPNLSADIYIGRPSRQSLTFPITIPKARRAVIRIPANDLYSVTHVPFRVPPNLEELVFLVGRKTSREPLMPEGDFHPAERCLHALMGGIVMDGISLPLCLMMGSMGDWICAGGRVELVMSSVQTGEGRSLHPTFLGPLADFAHLEAAMNNLTMNGIRISPSWTEEYLDALATAWDGTHMDEVACTGDVRVTPWREWAASATDLEVEWLDPKQAKRRARAQMPNESDDGARTGNSECSDDSSDESGSESSGEGGGEGSGEGSGDDSDSDDYSDSDDDNETASETDGNAAVDGDAHASG